MEVAAKNDIIILVKDGDSTTVRTVVNLAGSVEAPVEKGDVLGTLEVWEDGRVLAETELVAAETVESSAYLDYLERLFKRWSV